MVTNTKDPRGTGALGISSTLINKGIYSLELNSIINVNLKSKTTCKSTCRYTNKKLNNGVHI